MVRCLARRHCASNAHFRVLHWQKGGAPNVIRSCKNCLEGATAGISHRLQVRNGPQYDGLFLLNFDFLLTLSHAIHFLCHLPLAMTMSDPCCRSSAS